MNFPKAWLASPPPLPARTRLTSDCRRIHIGDSAGSVTGTSRQAAQRKAK